VSQILVAVDGLARSEDAVALARSLAPATAATFVLTTVAGDVAAPGLPTREGARLTVQHMSELLGLEPERIRTTIADGRSPAEGLYQLVEADDTALLIVGSSHAGQVGRVRPGRTGARLLAGAPCAIAITPYGYRRKDPVPLRRVGVAYDGSAESRIALHAGVAAARALHASLEVVTAMSHAAGSTDAAHVRDDLDAAIARLPAAIAARGSVLAGLPFRELAEKTAELDLLFIGSRSYGPMGAVVLGGTSAPLIRRSRCPAIVLPRGNGEDVATLFA
jgi:nucleotide-binding universal stress UspA family protein